MRTRGWKNVGKNMRHSRESGNQVSFHVFSRTSCHSRQFTHVLPHTALNSYRLSNLRHRLTRDLSGPLLSGHNYVLHVVRPAEQFLPPGVYRLKLGEHVLRKLLLAVHAAYRGLAARLLYLRYLFLLLVSK